MTGVVGMTGPITAPRPSPFPVIPPAVAGPTRRDTPALGWVLPLPSPRISMRVMAAAPLRFALQLIIWLGMIKVLIPSRPSPRPVILRAVAGPTRRDTLALGWVLRLRFAPRRVTGM